MGPQSISQLGPGRELKKDFLFCELATRPELKKRPMPVPQCRTGQWAEGPDYGQLGVIWINFIKFVICVDLLAAKRGKISDAQIF